MNMNDTFAGLENEFQEANEKFDVLLSMPINDDDDKEEMNLLHNLQKAKFIAEAAIENGKSEVEFSDDDATAFIETSVNVVVEHEIILIDPMPPHSGRDSMI